jgi:hypothetical protein
MIPTTPTLPEGTTCPLCVIPATGGNLKIIPTRERTTVQVTIHNADGKAVTVVLNRSEANAVSIALAKAVAR